MYTWFELYISTSNIQRQVYLLMTQIYIAVGGKNITVIENLLNEYLEQVKKWLTTNKLSLNLAKTEFMLIDSLKRLKEIDQNQDIRIGDVNIQRVSHSKLVGVHTYEGLTWNEYVTHIIKRFLLL